MKRLQEEVVAGRGWKRIAEDRRGLLRFSMEDGRGSQRIEAGRRSRRQQEAAGSSRKRIVQLSSSMTNTTFYT